MTTQQRKRKAPPRKIANTQGIQTLKELIQHLQITSWDAIIIGDGSGTSWNQGAGWAGILIDHYSHARKLFYGAMNTGTVMLGELLPYLHALMWYTHKNGPGRARRNAAAKLGRHVQIHIITDSQVIAAAGNHPESRHAHREIWAAFDWLEQYGFQLHFHFVPRKCVNMNILVDELSRQGRLRIENCYQKTIDVLVQRYPGIPNDVSIYDFNY